MIKKEKVIHLLLSLVIAFTSVNLRLENVYGSQWTEIVLEDNTELGEPVYQKIITPRIDAWQYGDYWKIGNKQINNSDVGENPEKLAELYDTYVEVSFELPTEVVQAVDNGQQLVVKATIGSDKIKDLDEIYEINTSYDNPSYTIENGKFYFKAYPRFNVDKEKNYKRLLPFIEDEIPIVNPYAGYGGNMYAMYDKNTKSKLGFAYAENYSSSPKNDGSVHFSDVVATNGQEGELKEGFTVNVIDDSWSESTYSSEDLRIGENTNLSKSAAMGMFFLYPTKLEFYLSGEQIEVSHVDIDTGEELEPKLIEGISLKTYSKKEFEDYEYIEYEFRLRK